MNDIEGFRSKRAKYRSENKSKIRKSENESSKRYYKRHKTKILEKQSKNEAFKQYRKEYFQKNKDKIMNDFYVKKYGITQQDKLNMLKNQGDVCMICKIKLLTLREAFVDHDHKTGKIRGILCNTCNRALGLLKDDVKVLESAINYLNYGKP